MKVYDRIYFCFTDSVTTADDTQVAEEYEEYLLLLQGVSMEDEPKTPQS
jgi:hypothetical protein